MDSQEPPINNIISNLSTEITSILKDKDASDSIVKKLSDVFQDLAIFKELKDEVELLTSQNKELETAVNDHLEIQTKLKDEVKTLEIEKKGLTDQLENWRKHTAQIMSANVHILNGLSKKEEETKKNVTFEVKEEITLEDKLKEKKKANAK